MALGHAFTDSNVVLAVGFGTTLLLAVIWSSVRDWKSPSITLTLFAWYIVLSIFGMAVTRVTAISAFQAKGILPADKKIADLLEIIAFSPRYAFFSVLLLATTVILLASRLQSGRSLTKQILIAFLAFGYCVSSYCIYPTRVQELLYGIVDGHNKRYYWSLGDKSNESSQIVMEAEEIGIYRPPVRPLPMPAIAGAAQSKTPHSSSTELE